MVTEDCELTINRYIDENDSAHRRGGPASVVVLFLQQVARSAVGAPGMV